MCMYMYVYVSVCVRLKACTCRSKAAARMTARALQQHRSGRATPAGDGRMSAHRSAVASPHPQRSAAASPHFHNRSGADSPQLHPLQQQTGGNEGDERGHDGQVARL